MQENMIQLHQSDYSFQGQLTLTIIIGPLFPPNFLQYGYTPLHNAAWRGSHEITSLLLAKGGQVDVKNNVHLCVYYGTPSWLKLITGHHLLVFNLTI